PRHPGVVRVTCDDSPTWGCDPHRHAGGGGAAAPGGPGFGPRGGHRRAGQPGGGAGVAVGRAPGGGRLVQVPDQLRGAGWTFATGWGTLSSGGRDSRPMGYGVIGSPTDSGSVSSGSS